MPFRITDAFDYTLTTRRNRMYRNMLRIVIDAPDGNEHRGVNLDRDQAMAFARSIHEQALDLPSRAVYNETPDVVDNVTLNLGTNTYFFPDPVENDDGTWSEDPDPYEPEEGRPGIGVPCWYCTGTIEDDRGRFLGMFAAHEACYDLWTGQSDAVVRERMRTVQEARDQARLHGNG